MNVKETGCEGVDWIQVPEGRIQWWPHMNVVMMFQVQQKLENFFSS
jgi:hypothetical protein